MASKMIFLTGYAAWVKAQKPDEEYNNYTMDFFPDADSWKEIEDSGLKLKKRTAVSDKLPENLQGADFIKVRRDPDKLLEGMNERPKVLIREGENEDGSPNYIPFAKLVGNGSFVTLKLNVYDSARGVGHRWEAVAVEDLVPYESEADSDLPF